MSLCATTRALASGSNSHQVVVQILSTKYWAGSSDPAQCHFLRLWRFSLSRFRYLCFDIFLRRFLMSEPIRTDLSKGELPQCWRDPGARSNYDKSTARCRGSEIGLAEVDDPLTGQTSLDSVRGEQGRIQMDFSSHPNLPVGTQRWIITVALLIATTIGLAMPVEAASWTPWKCSNAGCKYDQFRVYYDGNVVLIHGYFGSTASGSCDPSNDGIRWRLQQTSLFKGSNLIHQTGGDSWRTNCTTKNNPPPPTNWHKAMGTPQNVPPPGRSSHLWSWHEHECSGCSFQSYIRWDY